ARGLGRGPAQRAHRLPRRGLLHQRAIREDALARGLRHDRPRPIRCRSPCGRGVRARGRRRPDPRAVAGAGAMTRVSLRRGVSATTLVLFAVVSPLVVRGADNRSVPVGGLTALPGADAPGPNLVKNPRFDAADGDLTPWNARAAGPWSIDRAGREGRAALRLTSADAQPTVPQLEQTVTLEPGL